jgi:hypothetical protein
MSRCCAKLHDVTATPAQSLWQLRALILTAVLGFPGCAVPDRSTPANEFLINVPGNTIRLSRAQWNALPSEFEWAENFQARDKNPRHEYGRIVTIFKLPMTDDHRTGTQVSKVEYVEVLESNPGAYTIRVRHDKGRYWVMSAETLRAPEMIGKVATLTDRFQADIDNARYLLQSAL